MSWLGGVDRDTSVYSTYLQVRMLDRTHSRASRYCFLGTRWPLVEDCYTGDLSSAFHPNTRPSKVPTATIHSKRRLKLKPETLRQLSSLDIRFIITVLT